MTNRNSSNINIPEAREAMDKFKMEAASEVGVNKQKSQTPQGFPALTILWVTCLRTCAPYEPRDLQEITGSWRDICRRCGT